MDPFTQGALGAAFSQSFSKKKTMAVACVAGIFGGMAPDLDVVIGSSTDQLLALEYHRHFTHSIWFIPFGSLIVATALWLLFGKLLKKDIWNFKTTYTFTALGYATHATLDACTSYGTRLFWPFSNTRVSWDTISIIDPLVTIPLILFVIVSAKQGSAKTARIGMAVFFSYMSLGFIQNARVSETIEQIALDRGHKVERLKLNPTIGNLLVWRTTYQYDGRYYVDAVVAFPFKAPTTIEGSSVAAIDPETIYPELGTDSVGRNDIRRFNYFAQGYLFEYEGAIADLRYSGEPHRIEPIWGIYVDPTTPDAHVRYGSFRGPSGRALGTTWDMMWGDYVPEQKNDLAP